MMGSVRTHLVRMLDWEESHVGFDRCSGSKVLKLRIRSSDKSADLGAEALWGQETMAGLASAIVAWEMSTPVTAVAPARLNWRV